MLEASEFKGNAKFLKDIIIDPVHLQDRIVLFSGIWIFLEGLLFIVIYFTGYFIYIYFLKSDQSSTASERGK